MGEFVTDLKIEGWVLYGIGIFLIGCRMASRRIALGSWRKLQIDDYVMMFIIVTFTGTIVSVIEVASNGSNYLSEDDALALVAEGGPRLQSAIYGSQFTLILEIFTLVTTWLIKACLLIMYSRLTLGLKQNLAVKIVAGYCLFGFLLTMVLYLGVWCRPIQQYWQVPVENPQCATYFNHLITATVFNVTSDLMMLAIPIPILVRSQLPLKRKLILCGVFSLGIFVILAALLNRYYNFTVLWSPIFLNWYVGEVSTAVFVSNIPLCWPLIRSVFRLDTFNGTAKNSGNSYPHQSSNFYPRNQLDSNSGSRDRRKRDEEDMFSESEERIAGTPAWREGDLELTPVQKQGMGYKATIGGKRADGHEQGNEDEKDAWDSGAIVKTVQVEQHYSS